MILVCFQPVFDEPPDKDNMTKNEKPERDTKSKLENDEKNDELDSGDASNREGASPSRVNGEASNLSSENSSQDINTRANQIPRPIELKDLESSMATITESQQFSRPQNELKLVNNKIPQSDVNLTMEDIRAVDDGMRKILAAGQTQRGRRSHDDEVTDHNIDHIKTLIEKLDDEVSVWRSGIVWFVGLCFGDH